MTKRVQFDLSEDEKKIVNEKAKTLGLKTGTYAKMLVFRECFGVANQ